MKWWPDDLKMIAHALSIVSERTKDNDTGVSVVPTVSFTKRGLVVHAHDTSDGCTEDSELKVITEGGADDVIEALFKLLGLDYSKVYSSLYEDTEKEVE